MFKLAHYNDGKENYQSHEISLQEKDFHNEKLNLFSHDISDVTGYGETREEALKDFMKKMEYLFNEYRALETMLFDTNVLHDSMIEIDCTGKEIEK